MTSTTNRKNYPLDGWRARDAQIGGGAWIDYGCYCAIRLYKRGIVRGIDMEMVYTGAKPDEKATRVGRIKC